MGARHRLVSNSANPLIPFVMRVKAIKFAALLLANAAALALSSALPVQSFPQWITLNGENGDVLYDFNSLKALLNGIKQIDTYFTGLKRGVVTYISCPKWRITMAGDAGPWRIIAPESVIEILAYKVCGKS